MLCNPPTNGVHSHRPLPPPPGFLYRHKITHVQVKSCSVKIEYFIGKWEAHPPQGRTPLGLAKQRVPCLY